MWQTLIEEHISWTVVDFIKKWVRIVNYWDALIWSYNCFVFFSSNWMNTNWMVFWDLIACDIMCVIMILWLLLYIIMHYLWMIAWLLSLELINKICQGSLVPKNEFLPSGSCFFITNFNPSIGRKLLSILCKLKFRLKVDRCKFLPCRDISF